jgi:hypothetical protein
MMPAPVDNPRLTLIRRLFWWLVAVDCLLVIILGNIPSSGSDAAGNGMANGFAFLLQLVAFALLGLICLIFALVRAVPVRYFLIAVVMALCLTLMLLTWFSATA